MTHILIKCKKCGASEHIPVYGYVRNPIGVPLSRCPYCGTVYNSGKTAEWIQMEPWAKYLSIHPRAKHSAFFWAIPLSPVLFAPLALLLRSERATGLLFLLALGLAYCLAHWLLTVLRANNEKFLEVYCASILRTRNHRYRELLGSSTALFDEDFPKWVPLTKSSRDTITRQLSEELVTTDFEIPSLFDPRNSI